MNLANLNTSTACDQAVDVQLRHPATNEPLDVFVQVVGRDAAQYQAYMTKSVDDDLRREFNARKAGKNSEIPTVARGRERQIDSVAACTVGWRTGNEPTITNGADVLPFSPANARKLYGTLGLDWIRQQVDTAIGDLTNFMPG